MATSSFTTVFKMPKKTLREIAKNIDKPVVRFKLSEKDKESLATSGERFQKWLDSIIGTRYNVHNFHRNR